MSTHLLETCAAGAPKRKLAVLEGLINLNGDISLDVTGLSIPATYPSDLSVPSLPHEAIASCDSAWGTPWLRRPTLTCALYGIAYADGLGVVVVVGVVDAYAGVCVVLEVRHLLARHNEEK